MSLTPNYDERVLRGVEQFKADLLKYEEEFRNMRPEGQVATLKGTRANLAIPSLSDAEAARQWVILRAVLGGGKGSTTIANHGQFSDIHLEIIKKARVVGVITEQEYRWFNNIRTEKEIEANLAVAMDRINERAEIATSRKPGPRTRGNAIAIQVMLTDEENTALVAYCDKNNVSKAEAIRRGISLLPS